MGPPPWPPAACGRGGAGREASARRLPGAVRARRPHRANFELKCHRLPTFLYGKWAASADRVASRCGSKATTSRRPRRGPRPRSQQQASSKAGARSSVAAWPRGDKSAPFAPGDPPTSTSAAATTASIALSGDTSGGQFTAIGVIGGVENALLRTQFSECENDEFAVAF